MDARRPGRVLPDARRRRADHVAPAAAVVHQRARAGGGDRARQHRPRPARPGPAAARPGRHRSIGRGRRGRARVPPRRARVPQRPPRRGSNDGDFAALVARLLVFPTWRLALLDAAGRLPRPGARRDRGQGRQGTDLPPRLRRAVGGPARRRHRRCRTSACRARSTPSGRSSPSCSSRTTSSRAARRRPGTVRDEVDGVLAPGAGRRRRCDRRTRSPRPGGRAATACTPRRWAALLAELQSVARAHPDATW